MNGRNARGSLDDRVLSTPGRLLALGVLPIALLGLALTSAAEAQVTRAGVLRATISENFQQHESTTTYSLRSGGETTHLLPTTPVTASTGDRVVAEGAMHDGQLVGQVTQEQDLTSEADALGPHKVAVLLMKFPGDGSEPWPLSQAREEVFTGVKSANAYLQEESWGRISLTGKTLNTDGDVFGWFTVNNPSGCANTSWNAEAKAQAESQGISLSGYEHIIYISTFQLGCGWLGKASLGGPTVNINGTFGGSQVIAHELGHNLSMRHAGSWNCTKGGARVPVSTSCTAQEYGDPFDVMGNLGMRHSSAWNLRLFSLVRLSDNSIETVNSPGDYTLQSTLNSSPTPHVLRIARQDSPFGAPLWWYYLEIRQRGGLFEDFNDATMSGVSIRVVAEGQEPETRLLDNTPATSTFSDAPLQVGRTFYDGHVYVTVLSAGGGTATVSVGFGAYTDAEDPTPPSNLSASQNASGVRLQWNESGDNIGVSSYLVFRDGSKIGTSPTTSFTDTTASLGTHAYTVYAEDEAGNMSDASTPKVFDVTDVVKPSAPTGLTANLDAGNVTLLWDASTDNVGVTGYVVVRDGSRIGATPAQAFTDAGAPVGKHTYMVYAEDAAGNSSSGSVVAVTVPGAPSTIPTPSPSPERGGERKQPQKTKPLLRWKRRAGGGVVLKFDASQLPDIYRVSLWLGSSPLYSKSGQALVYVWKPKAVRCNYLYKLTARAHARSGKETSSVLRLRSNEIEGGSGKCRGG